MKLAGQNPRLRYFFLGCVPLFLARRNLARSRYMRRPNPDWPSTYLGLKHPHDIPRWFDRNDLYREAHNALAMGRCDRVAPPRLLARMATAA
jgi:hypothetical protein